MRREHLRRDRWDALTCSLVGLLLAAACSSPSASKTSTPPGAPVDVFAVAGNGSVTVSWKEPASTGTSGVTGYTVTGNPGGATATTTGATTATVAGLTNGTPYVLSVVANSSVGSGPGTLSNIVTPEAPSTPTGLPGAPLGVLAVAGDQQATVSWSPPASTGGALGDYAVTVIPGGQTTMVGGTTTTITGLVDGTTYLFSVAATNALGTGLAASSNPVTPEAVPGAPGAPTGVMVSAVGDGWATVTWTVPASHGSPLESYIVTPSAGPAVTVPVPATSATLSGLTDGKAYVFSVVATNAIGTGPAGTSAAATPVGPPAAPVGVFAVAGDRQATITWSPPVDAGGDALGDYTVTVTPGGATSSVAGTTTTITGLTDGTTYIFSVAATTAAGAGPATPSNVVTPEPVAGAPLAPSDVTVSAVGDGWATVTWMAPESDGGSPIQSYTITPSGGSPTTVPAGGTSVTLSGLTDGTAYIFSVFATNAVGNGPAATSPAATPIGLPGAPTGVLAIAGNQQVTVTWSAPLNTGGTPLGSYVVMVSPGGVATSVAGTSTVITGLTSGASYLVSVAATNAVGTGPAASSNVVALVPNAALSTFTAAPASPSTEDPVALRLVLSDPSGNPLPDWPVTLAVSAPGVVLEHGSGSTASDGSFVASLTSSVPQTVVVTATTTGLTQTVSVTFTASVVCGAAPSFAAVTPLPMLGGTLGLAAVGDFNGDGKPDVVVTDEGTMLSGMTVNVLLGNGDGTFQTPSTLTVGAGPFAPALGDFNGDGWLDIAVTNTGDGTGNTLSILLGNGDGTFQPESTATVGTEPAGLVAVDLDGDGRLDLVTANLDKGTGDTLSVLLGNGDGTFQPQLTVTVGKAPQELAAGDFNGDGKPDLVVTDTFGNTVNVLLGNGDGTFQAPSTITAGTYPGAVAVGDFDGDGKLDLAVSDIVGLDPSQVSLLLGNGDGTFQPPTTTEVGAGPDTMAVGDFNGDGKLDLVTGDYGSTSINDTVSVLLGNGDGTFQAALSEGVGNAPTIAVGDMNADGRLDIVSVNSTDGTLSLLLNGCAPSTTGGLPGAPSGVVAVGGSGSAALTWTPPSITGGGTVESYVVTVTPGGASTKVAGTSTTVSGLTNGTTYVFSVAATNATGTGPAASSNAVTPSAVPVVPGAPATVSVTAVGDGWVTVSWTAPTSNGGSGILSYTVTPAGGAPTTVPAAATATTISGLTDGTAYTFSVYATNAVGNGPPTTSGAATPMGLPGAPIGVFAQAGNLQATVTWNPPADTGGGTLGDYVVTVTPGGTPASVSGTSTTITGLTAGSAYVISVAATSAAGTGPATASNVVAIVPDSSLSTLTATPSSTTTESAAAVRLVLQAASGAALSGWPVTLIASGSHVALSHASGVTDSTGTYVASLSTTQAQTVQVTATSTGLTLTVTVAFASPIACAGAPAFAAVTPAPGVGGSPVGLATADFNGDGQPDLISVNAGSATVSVLLGNGDGTFRSQVTASVGAQPLAIAVADFNDDGWPDAVTANSDSNTMSVLLGDGDGSLSHGAANSTGSYPQGIAVGDFNGDGQVDVIVANGGGTTVSVYLGNGDGTFAAQVHYQVGYYPSTVAVGDFDGDGRLDAVVTNQAATVNVLLGNGDGTFQNKLTASVGGMPLGLALADFNGDGKLDLACANKGQNTVSVLVGNGDGTFQPQATYAVGSSPVSVAAGDLNGDGKADLVATNSDDLFVSVLLGNGDGTFQAGSGSPLQHGQAAVALGDFNSDGRLDIAVANSGPASVTLLANGCLESSSALPGAPPGVLAVGGNQDAAVSWNAPATTGGFAITGYTVTVTPGGATTTVTGTSTTVTGLTNGTTYVISVAAITSEGTGPSSASNTVTPAAAPGSPTAPQTPAVAATGDGWAIITWGAPTSTGGSPILSYTVTPSGGAATTLPAPATSVTITGLTDGTAYTFAVFATNAAGNSPSATTGSGTPKGVPGAPIDVLATSAGKTATVTWKAPASNGSAITGYTITLEPGGTQTTAASTATSATLTGLTAGTSYEVSVAATSAVGTGPASSSNVVTIAPSPSLSTFTATPVAAFTGDPVTLHVVLADASGTALSGWPITITATGTDVVLDHATGTTSATGTFDALLSSKVAQSINLSAATSGLTQTLVLELAPAVICSESTTFQLLANAPGVGSQPQGVAVGDFNLDGKLDFVATNYGEDAPGTTVSVLIGNGDGSFKTQVTDTVGGNPWGVVVADFNTDGYPDIAAINSVFGGPNTVSVLLGNGDGTFQSQKTTTAGNLPEALAVGDLNGDGKPDVVTLDYINGLVIVLLGKGDGTFTVNALTPSVGAEPTSVALADFNNDGKLDVVTANYASNTVSVLLGNGDGTFQTQETGGVGTQPHSVAVGDFNLDGDLDIVATNYGNSSGTTVSVLLGKGNGLFLTQATYTVGAGPWSVAVGDLNGDGRPDIVTANPAGENASVLLGKGDGTFAAAPPESTGSAPQAVALGDVNGDGRLDILVASGSGNNVSVLINTCQ